MKKLLFSLIALASIAIFVAPVQANLTSTFDSSNEGWTGDDPTNHDWTAGPSSWQSIGGNPGGFLEGQETNPTGGTGYYMAPSAWLGNWSQYIGGTLKYDIKILSGTTYFSDDDVRIYSGNSYVHLTDTTAYWTGWKTFDVTLNAAAFGTTTANFNGIMSNVTAFWIRGEYINGSEAEGLDNVMVSGTTVPEPSTLLLFASGLAGLASLAWRKN